MKLASMIGHVIAGRYRLEEQIATGGMGTVWRAHDQILERPVAVKLLHDALAEDARAAARFRREALTAAQVHHPNMAGVFDYVEDRGRPGIVMELVDSETLAHRIARDGTLPPDEACRIADRVLRALQTAHRAGIVHRDVKPGNILLTPAGDVKVTDFGIARSLGDSALTATGTVMGTPHYSAPEQVRGENATPGTDLYALGIVLYEMLTGVRPFEADTPVAVAMSRLTETPAPPRTLRPELSQALEAVVMRALAIDPADRFPDAARMREALAEEVQRAPADVPTAAAAVPAPSATVRSPRPDAGTTQALPLDELDIETRVLPSAAPAQFERATRRQRRRERRRQAAAAAVGEVAPPRWARRRLVFVLLPLLILAGVTAALVAAWQTPSPVALPSFTGKTVAQARALARTVGVTVHTRNANSDRASGTVVSQSPPKGTRVQPGSTVELKVSDGTCCRIPNVTGMTRADAESTLAGAGFSVGTVFFQAPDTGSPGEVQVTNPPGGAEAHRGDVVNIYVVREPPPPEEDRCRRGKGGRDCREGN